MIARPMVLRDEIEIVIHARDQISGDGIAVQLRRQGIEVLKSPRDGTATVAMVVTDHLDDEAVDWIREIRTGSVERVVAVVASVDEAALATAIEAGMCALVRRQEATPRSLGDAIRCAAAGDGAMPNDLLGQLLQQVGRLHRQVQAQSPNLTFTGIGEREAKVLRLLADGCDTAEVGRRLYYSERTVKNIIHDVTCRLNLRNRTHAVAHALRHRLI